MEKKYILNVDATINGVHRYHSHLLRFFSVSQIRPKLISLFNLHQSVGRDVELVLRPKTALSTLEVTFQAEDEFVRLFYSFTLYDRES